VYKNRSTETKTLSFPFASAVVIHDVAFNGIQSPSRKMGGESGACVIWCHHSRKDVGACNIMAVHLPQVLCHQSLK